VGNNAVKKMRKFGIYHWLLPQAGCFQVVPLPADMQVRLIRKAFPKGHCLPGRQLGIKEGKAKRCSGLFKLKFRAALKLPDLPAPESHSLLLPQTQIKPSK